MLEKAQFKLKGEFISSDKVTPESANLSPLIKSF